MGVSGGCAANPEQGSSLSVTTMQHNSVSATKLRRLNLLWILPAVTAAGILTVVLGARTWEDAVILASGVVAGVVGFVFWSYGRVMDVAVPCLAVTSLVWLYGVVVVENDDAFFGLLLVGPLVIPDLRRYRLPAAVGLVGLVAAVGSMVLWPSSDDPGNDLLRFAVVPAVTVAIVVVWRFPNYTFYAIVRELEESRERDAELAVMRERVRFAGDLHDIQGHTLHVVKLKADLACRTLRTNADAAEHELREIHALVTETIGQTKALAYGQRRLNLQAEMQNATNLLEAAGARVTISGVGEPNPEWSDALSQVLRETTTNILRHARPRVVAIELGRAGLMITNDGADRQQSPELRGLAALRPRVAESGGELVVDQVEDIFRTAAVYGITSAAPVLDVAVTGNSRSPR